MALSSEQAFDLALRMTQLEDHAHILDTPSYQQAVGILTCYAVQGTITEHQLLTAELLLEKM